MLELIWIVIQLFQKKMSIELSELLLIARRECQSWVILTS